MNWDFLVQQLVNGLTLGSMYALIALGYTMVYGILKLLNFAHGEVYMMGAFVGLGVMTALGGPGAPVVPVALMVLLMFLAAMVGSSLLAVGLERFAYRRLREAPPSSFSRRRSCSSAPSGAATRRTSSSTSARGSTGGR